MDADLHIHTQASDGKDSVLKRVEQAKEYGLDTIAITDHDCINNRLENRTEHINGVEVITGSEIKCQIDGTGIEILGYFLDPSDPEICRLFETMEDNRTRRMESMLENVNQGEDLSLTLEDVEKYADGTLGRPHLGEALVDRDIARDMDEAFRKYIGEDASKDYYVETEKLTSKEVIDTVNANGGATSLAHPGRDLTEETAEQVVEKLVSQGLDGIEVPYTYQHKRQEGYGINFGVQKAYDLARENDLIVTGGSDCHGEDSGKYNIGKIRLGSEHVESLRKITYR